MFKHPYAFRLPLAWILMALSSTLMMSLISVLAFGSISAVGFVLILGSSGIISLFMTVMTSMCADEAK